MLKIFPRVRSNKLILSLTIITFIILAIPLLLYGVNGTFFYRTDPDIVYVTNALLFIKSGAVFYADHPGTPSIVLLSISYLPLRIVSQFFLHQNFIQWSFNNFALLLYYSRFCQLILYSLALLVFLKVVSNMSKSVTITLFSWFAFFWLMGVDRSISIVPENLSLFLTAFWLFFFIKFLSKRNYKLNIILVTISALAVANKFTSIFLLIPSIFLPTFINKSNIKQKIIRFLLNILVSILVFFLGILPAINRISYIINWMKVLFFHTDADGTGVVSTFNLKSYFGSLNSLFFHVDPVAFFVFLSVLLLMTYLIIIKKVRKGSPIVFLTLTTSLGVLIFAKYPVDHYLLVNLALIIFCLSYFLTKVNIILLPKIGSASTLMNFLLLFFGILFVGGVNAYLTDATVQLKPYISLQRYVYKNPAKINTLWGYENMDYTLYSWTHTWSLDVFEKQFKIKPALQLASDLKTINSSDNSGNNVFDYCWDKAYLPKELAIDFLNMYKDKNLKAFPIPGDNSIYEIDSAHCTMK